MSQKLHPSTSFNYNRLVYAVCLIFLLVFYYAPSSFHVQSVSPPLSLTQSHELTPYKDPLNWDSDPNSNPSSGSLAARLAKKYPYDRTRPIPKRIWQIWKTPLEETLETEVGKKYVRTWINQPVSKQQDAEYYGDLYEYTLISDNDIDEFLAAEFSEFPEIISTFYKLPLPILKFDFLRYLVLFSKGGVYTDIDTILLKPLSEWIDNDFAESVGFMVNIEADLDCATWKYHTARRVQFAQWTFKSRVGHPILRMLIEFIVQITDSNYKPHLQMIKLGRQYQNLNSLYTVLDWTGPGAFTDVIFKYLNEIYPMSKISNDNLLVKPAHESFEYFHREFNTVDLSSSRPVGWTNFTKISKPIMFDDVLILPINSFNAFNDKTDIETDSNLTYVQHGFQGSWKNMI